MYNNQNHGGMTPQMMQMQRLMANRPQRTSAFLATGGGGDMNMPAELNDRRFAMNWAQQQRNFGLVHQQNMLGFPQRSEFNNFGMMAPANPIPAPSSGIMAQVGTSSNSNSSSTFIGSSGIRMPVFKCVECNIVKNSSEELEVHTKTEHLNWLPFICPHCNAARASDIQMREHMHSFHKKNDNKYFYHDNPQAKKILQEMMDKALFGASQQLKRRNGFEDGGNNIQKNSGAESVKKARMDDALVREDQQQRGLASRKPVEEAQQLIKQSTENGSQDRRQSIDEETDAQLNTIFGRNINVKSEFDMSVLDGTPSPRNSMMMPNEEDDLPDDNSHQLDALQNVAAMFSASGGSDRIQGSSRSMGGGRQAGFFNHPKRIVRNRPGPMTSKKRVLGECGRCQKPITAGARQMHMFFHLGKDMKTFRFRCKHAGCDVEHYRKDQMENHQSKAHGRVDPSMMDDRSQELYNLVQKMSLELLGTAGNTPGPTAAKAQVLYDQQMRELQTNFGSRRRNNNHQSGSPTGAPHTGGGQGSRQMFDSANRKIEDLECRLCHKNIMSRIRGFHILWHLNNDLGIVRYGCKHCNFKHDRPQSVVAHGVREHDGAEDCCEDLLYNYEDELKSMSKACFGVERLFEKEIRRRNKLERDGAGEHSPNQEGYDDEDSQAGSESRATRRRSAQIGNLKVPLRAENSDRSWNSWTPKDQVKKRRSLRRFGTRRVKSRRQKEEMVKLREVSMRLGGAQYFKKKSNEAIPCEKCGKVVTNRLSDHAYTHLDGCDLFRCQQCNLGHYSRETIVRHLRDFHNTSNEPPLDNRLRYAQEIKEAIRECYPTLFVDAPIPTKEDMEKLKTNLKLKNMVVDAEEEEEEEDDDEEKEEESVGYKEEEEEEGAEGQHLKEEDEEEEEEEGDELMETAGTEESGVKEEEEGAEEALTDEEEMAEDEEDPEYGEDEEEEAEEGEIEDEGEERTGTGTEAMKEEKTGRGKAEVEE